MNEYYTKYITSVPPGIDKDNIKSNFIKLWIFFKKIYNELTGISSHGVETSAITRYGGGGYGISLSPKLILIIILVLLIIIIIFYQGNNKICPKYKKPLIT